MDQSLYTEYNGSRRTADKRSLCHAPSYGMHLAQNGSVLACGLTRGHPLGQYPDQSLMDIWFGRVAIEMRKAMRATDFPAACEACKAQADSKLFSRIRSRDYDPLALPPTGKNLARIRNRWHTGRFGEYPSSMAFELSNTCNLECVMCSGMLSSSIRKNRDKLPPLLPNYGPELLPQLRAFIPHLKEALFFGGEPFLIPMYLDILDLFRDLNAECMLYITTNGTVLNQRVKALVESLPRLQIVVSLDAVTSETYGRIRVNASLEQVLKNVRYFKGVTEALGRRLVIKPTFMTLNAMEYPAIYDFANAEEIALDVGVLLHPPSLSLAHLPLGDLEAIHSLWVRHEPSLCPDPGLAARNARAFRMAIDQVAVWLDEKRQSMDATATTPGTSEARVRP